jgi:hypothetical protein
LLVQSAKQSGIALAGLLVAAVILLGGWPRRFTGD